MKSKDLRKVVERLKGVAHLADRKNSVQMNVATIDVHEQHPCETISCFGGWYAIARFWEWEGVKGTYIGESLGQNECETRIDFHNGADQMAKDLGFEDNEELEKWAEENPDLWGNEYGVRMFHDGQAFGMDPYVEPQFRDIVAHLETVADALESKEKGGA